MAMADGVCQLLLGEDGASFCFAPDYNLIDLCVGFLGSSWFYIIIQQIHFS